MDSACRPVEFNTTSSSLLQTLNSARSPATKRPAQTRTRSNGKNSIRSGYIIFFIFKWISSFPPQVDDADSQCSISGVTVDSTETEGMITDIVDSEDLLLVTDTLPPRSEDFHPPSAPCTPLLSPADRALARLNRSASSEPSSQRESPHMDGCDLRYEQISVFFFRRQQCPLC